MRLSWDDLRTSIVNSQFLCLIRKKYISKSIQYFIIYRGYILLSWFLWKRFAAYKKLTDINSWLMGLCCSNLSFLCTVLWTIVHKFTSLVLCLSLTHCFYCYLQFSSPFFKLFIKLLPSVHNVPRSKTFTTNKFGKKRHSIFKYKKSLYFSVTNNLN